jgi:hypothetical protein
MRQDMARGTREPLLLAVVDRVGLDEAVVW